MEKPRLKSIKFNGETGALAQNIIDYWLLGLRETNPAILDMFRDRDIPPYRDLLPWSGEFAGKYITGAYYIYQITHDERLYAYILRFIEELLTYQDTDGYLGCYSRQCRLTGAFSQNPDETGATWDSWSHYHILFGLLLWYRETGKADYLAAAEKIAALFQSLFYGGKKPLVSIGSSEMNLAIYHGFALLYNLTGKAEYLDFARFVEVDFSDEKAGNYMNLASEGCEFYQCPRPRWESLHAIMGIAEMYRATGEARYMTAVSWIVRSILKTDVHNTGAFSTEEQAVGNPYKNLNIETCCVVAYYALVCDVLPLLDKPELLDFLERAHYNAILGYYSPTGRWSTYNTPMDGVKCSSCQSIVFQSRPGSPELNCCSVNAPRGVGMISQWAVLEQDGIVYINSYEDLIAITEDGLSIAVSGDYPCCSRIQLHLSSGCQTRSVALRIPSWSKNTTVAVCGEAFHPQAGTYLTLQRIWEDTVTVELDFSPRVEAGELDYAGKASIFVGPVLYAFDQTTNPAFSVQNLPLITTRQLSLAKPERQSDGSIRLSLDSGVILTDFYHAGTSGCEYKTWLTVE